MIGTSFLLPLYSPHIHSRPLLDDARRGDVSAFCLKRPRSFPAASLCETMAATAATLLDPLSFLYQGESRRGAHCTDTCVRTGMHTRKRALKCVHVVTSIRTLTLIDTLIHRDTHTAATAQREDEWCVAHVWDLITCHVRCNLGNSGCGVSDKRTDMFFAVFRMRTKIKIHTRLVALLRINWNGQFGNS
jgi:hypothetical protein